MVILNGCDSAEHLGDVGEPLFTSHLGRFGVLLNALFLLFCRSHFQILYRRRKNAGVYTHGVCDNRPVGEIFQEYLGVAKLVGRCLVKDVRILEI